MCWPENHSNWLYRLGAFTLYGLLIMSVACSNDTPNGRATPVKEKAERGFPPEGSAQPSVSPGLSPTPRIEASAELTDALDRLWARTPRGCLVVEAAGSLLYEAGDGAAAEPASAIKVLTASAALEVLGESERFRTSVTARARPIGGTIEGDLWLVGGGDPVLATNSWAANYTGRQPHTSLDELADLVAAAGVRQVEGSVVGDESRYDGLRYVESWPKRFIVDGEIGPLSALTVNDGFSTWGHPGVPFRNPPADAAAIFKELLEDRGIRVAGGSIGGRAISNAVELASVRSTDLRSIASAMLRDSDNGTAEMLIKEIGLRRSGTGSTSAGTAAVTETFSERSYPVDGAQLNDGSGLSPMNRVSCRLLTSILRDASAALTSGLPVAGQTGTLSERFRGTPAAGKLRAKTGSLEGVAALAGFAENRAGQTLTFSYLANGLPKAVTARSLQDYLSTVLVADTTRLEQS